MFSMDTLKKIAFDMNKNYIYVCSVCDTILYDEIEINSHIEDCKYTKSSKILSKEILYCIKCNYQTDKRYNWKRHVLSKKHKKIVNEIQKVKTGKYKCKPCNYQTNVKCNYDKHIITSKHKTKTLEYSEENNETLKPNIEPETDSSKYTKYGDDIKSSNLDNQMDSNTVIPDIMKTFIEESQRLQNLLQNQNNTKTQYHYGMTELNSKISNIESKLEQYTTPTQNNIYVNQINNNYNTINNVLNYLNNECKDAMNLSDFINNLTITYEDLLYLKDHGQAKTFERTLLRELKYTDIKKRPIHCTDHKRKRFFIKEDNTWENDETNPFSRSSKINKMLRSVHMKQVKVLQTRKQTTPNWLDDDQLLVEYNDITRKLATLYDDKEQKKIINNLTNNVILNK
jgi:hypothetical protein